jgi:hypothetical protein
VLRAAIVPGMVEKASELAHEHAHTTARMSRARLLNRVFDLDLEHCPQCGGEFRIITAIEEPTVIVRILAHLSLPVRALSRSPSGQMAFFKADQCSRKERFCGRTDNSARHALARGGRTAANSAVPRRCSDQRMHARGGSVRRTPVQLTLCRAGD